MKKKNLIKIVLKFKYKYRVLDEHWWKRLNKYQIWWIPSFSNLQCLSFHVSQISININTCYIGNRFYVMILEWRRYYVWNQNAFLIPFFSHQNSLNRKTSFKKKETQNTSFAFTKISPRIRLSNNPTPMLHYIHRNLPKNMFEI